MKSLGFKVVDSLINGGVYTYPNEKYQSSVVQLDTESLHTLNSFEREDIHELQKEGRSARMIKEDDQVFRVIINLGVFEE